MASIELPCSLGDIVFLKVDGLSLPARRKVICIELKGDNDDLIIFTGKNCRTGETSRFSIGDFGHTVFVDHDEAFEKIRAASGRPARIP